MAEEETFHLSQGWQPSGQMANSITRFLAKAWLMVLFFVLHLSVPLQATEPGKSVAVGHLDVVGSDRDKNDFERVTVHMRLIKTSGVQLFDVLVYAKNQISIVHSADRCLYGINACDATKSNNITLVYLKAGRLVVAPHVDDWIVDEGGWWYIHSIDGTQTVFDTEGNPSGTAKRTLNTADVFK